MKQEHRCHCHDHSPADDLECSCGHHHGEGDCGCDHEHGDDDAAGQIAEMFGMNDAVPDDALGLLQMEMDECDELSELLGVGTDPDVDDLLQEAIADLSPQKKKTLMNLALILHDYIPD